MNLEFHWRVSWTWLHFANQVSVGEKIIPRRVRSVTVIKVSKPQIGARTWLESVPWNYPFLEWWGLLWSFCDKVYGLLEFYGAHLRHFRILANFASIEVVFFARPATRSFVLAERMVVVQIKHAYRRPHRFSHPTAVHGQLQSQNYKIIISVSFAVFAFLSSAFRFHFGNVHVAIAF